MVSLILDGLLMQVHPTNLFQWEDLHKYFQRSIRSASVDLSRLLHEMTDLAVSGQIFSDGNNERGQVS